MANMMQIIRIMLEHCRARRRSLRIFMGFLVGIAFMMMPIQRYLLYAAALDSPVNALEPFIMILSEGKNLAFIVLGLLLVLSDAPFMTRRTPYVIMRTSRRRFAAGSFLYMFFMSAAYLLSLLLFSAIAVSKQAYWGNFWSNPMYQLTQRTTTADIMDYYRVYFAYPHITSTLSPFSAAVHVFLLCFLYVIILASIMFVLNSIKGRIWGSIAALLVHAIGYVMILESMFYVPRYSLLANALLVSQSFSSVDGKALTFGYSYAFLLVVLLVLMYLSFRVFKRTDFRISSGEEDG